MVNANDPLRAVIARARAYDEALAAALGGERARLVHELRALRVAAGMSQQEVARLVGVTRGTIANIETGRFGLSVETLIGYAAVMGRRVTLGK
jgi:DNA-binding XRE family transcriptional regulator